MRKDQLKKFKKMLDAQLNSILENERVVREDCCVNSDDRYDEIDQATTDSAQSMIMRLGNRKTLYIKKLNEALKRIDEGTYGECDSCGEDIGVLRLQARPTTTLCVSCKEDQERKEVLTAAGREHKSLGESFSRRYA
jgi:DnaK suppressor protein